MYFWCRYLYKADRLLGVLGWVRCAGHGGLAGEEVRHIRNNKEVSRGWSALTAHLAPGVSE